MSSVIYSENIQPAFIEVTWSSMVHSAPKVGDVVDGERHGDFGDWYELPKTYSKIEAKVNGPATISEGVIEVSDTRLGDAAITRAKEAGDKDSVITDKGVNHTITSRNKFIRPHFWAGRGAMQAVIRITL